MKMDFGVVNYNGGPALLRCVDSILAQEGVEVQVRVFDNASADGSADALAEHAPTVQTVRSDRNLGYAGAVNRLVERMDGDVVVLCNMDLEFVPGWARAVLAALRKHPGADAVASVVVETTEPPRLNSLGVRFYPDLHAQNEGSGEPYRPERVEEQAQLAFGAYGAVMCFRRTALQDIRFDESFFLFFEETDFFLRFHLLGHDTVLAPDALVYHERSHSTRRYSTLKLYYGERNRLTTVFKLLPAWYWPVSLWHSVGRYLRLARTASAGRGGDGEGPGATPAMPPRWVIIGTILRAWSAAVVRLPATLAARRRFWRGAPASPRDALALMRRYRLPASRLTIR
ncbi:MAG TPA: glycosyltransferase family 2 protein [Longimicrobiales bacterium]|nr:glycosyltransferase family 2 protein [Longimicrobiales bacterium]